MRSTVNAASMLSAVSATVAAVLVAVNLYISGRREQSRWAREALVDIFIAFLDAGFSGSAAGNRLSVTASADSEVRILHYRQEIEQAHRTETEMLTKMRLLTTPAVVEAAMGLHVATHAFTDLVSEDLPGLSGQERDLINDRIWQARRSFLAAAKAEIGLRPEVSFVRHERA